MAEALLRDRLAARGAAPSRGRDTDHDVFDPIVVPGQGLVGLLLPSGDLT